MHYYLSPIRTTHALLPTSHQHDTFTSPRRSRRRRTCGRSSPPIDVPMVPMAHTSSIVHASVVTLRPSPSEHYSTLSSFGTRSAAPSLVWRWYNPSGAFDVFVGGIWRNACRKLSPGGAYIRSTWGPVPPRVAPPTTSPSSPRCIHQRALCMPHRALPVCCQHDTCTIPSLTSALQMHYIQSSIRSKQALLPVQMTTSGLLS